MSPRKRIGLGIVGILLVGAVVSLFLVRSSLDGFVRAALENYGSAVTETRVSVASVALHLREGKGTVKGIVVANPDGFSGDDAFRLGGLEVDLDVMSLAGDPIVIEEIRVAGPRIVVEPLRDGRVNLDVLGENAKAYRTASNPEGEGSSRRIRIQTLVFEEGEIVVDLEALGKGRTTARLPGFRLTNLGGPQGEEPGRIGQEIVGALVREGLSAAARAGLAEEVKEVAREKAGEAAGDAIKKLLN